MTMWNEAITRRAMLRLGVSSAALLALPGRLGRVAGAATAPHFLVTFIADGGWDVTQVFDVHDPLDATDGIDVDVPQAISGLPPSRVATAGGSPTCPTRPPAPPPMRSSLPGAPAA